MTSGQFVPGSCATYFYQRLVEVISREIWKRVANGTGMWGDEGRPGATFRRILEACLPGYRTGIFPFFPSSRVGSSLALLVIKYWIPVLIEKV